MYRTLSALAGAALLLSASVAQAEVVLSDTAADGVSAGWTTASHFNNVGFLGSFNDNSNNFGNGANSNFGNNNSNFGNED